MTELKSVVDGHRFTTDEARDIWKEVVPEVVQNRVLRGATLLDRFYVSTGPHAWPSAIDLATLNLQSPLACVCGQLEGMYERALVRYGLAPDDQAAREYSLEARDHGFVWSITEDDGSDHSPTELTVAWRAYLTLRRSGELT